jgi:hypothetical protein
VGRVLTPVFSLSLSLSPPRGQRQLEEQWGPSAVGDTAGPGLPEGPQLSQWGPGDHQDWLLLRLLQGAAGWPGLPPEAGQWPFHHPRVVQVHALLP